MNRRHPRTTADIAAYRLCVRVDCKRCGAVQTLMPFDLLMRCGTVPLSDLQPRLRCRRCRHRQAKMSWMPPF